MIFSPARLPARPASGRFHVKILPPTGPNVWRFAVAPLHVAYACAVLGLAIVAPVGISLERLSSAEARVGTYDRVARAQHDRLLEMDRRAEDLTRELDRIQTKDAEIERLIAATAGVNAEATSAARRAEIALRTPAVPITSARSASDRRGRIETYALVRARMAALAAQTDRLRREDRHVRALAGRILRVRGLVASARLALTASVPSIEPIANAAITSPFGFRALPWPEFHHGVDLAADYGTPVRSSAAGVVVSAGFEAGGYGNKIDIDHGNGFHTWYAHLSRVAVKPGDRIEKARTIGFVGSTGASTGPHLHYQIMRDGKAIDPTPFLNGVPPNVLASLK